MSTLKIILLLINRTWDIKYSDHRKSLHIHPGCYSRYENKPDEGQNICDSWEFTVSLYWSVKEFVAVLPRVKHLFHPLTGVRFTPAGNKQSPKKQLTLLHVSMNCQQDVLQVFFKSLKR